MFKIKPKPASFIGIDIQHAVLRILRLRKHKRRYCVDMKMTVELPEGVIVDGRVKQQDKLIAIMSGVVKKMGIAGMEVGMTLPSSLVYMRRLRAPVGLCDVEIQAEIMSQVRRDYPGMTYEVCMDYCLVADEEPGYVGIFFVVAKQESVSHYVDAVQAAGLILKIIDIDVFALNRLHHQLTKQENQKTDYHAVLLVDEYASCLTVYKGEDFTSQQRWDIVDVSQLCVVLIEQIERMLQSIPLQKKLTLSLYCTEDKGGKLSEALVDCSRLIVLPHTLSRLMEKAAGVDESTNLDAIIQYAVVLGVAMRDIPKW